MDETSATIAVVTESDQSDLDENTTGQVATPNTLPSNEEKHEQKEEEKSPSSISTEPNPTRITPITEEDQKWIEEADAFYKEEQYFKASACLKKVRDLNNLTRLHHFIIKLSDQAFSAMQECMLPCDDAILEQNGYHKQTEIHNTQFDTSIHYKVNPHTYNLTSRLESIIECDLLIPLVSVLNESQLYETWMPKFTFPIAMGISESKKLGEYGRGNQIILVTVQMPYPFSTRQVIQHAIAIDTIDDHNAIMIQVNSLEPGKNQGGKDEVIIDEPKKGVVRIDEEINMLIRACPKDHPLYIKRVGKLREQHEKEEKLKTQKEKRQNKKQSNKSSTISTNMDDSGEVTTTTSAAISVAAEIQEEETKHDNTNKNDSIVVDVDNQNILSSKLNMPSVLLVTTLLHVDAHVSAVPQRVQNFFTRTALSSLWHSLLHVADEVRTGKRKQHLMCIEQNKQLYDWVQQRANIMIQKLYQQEHDEMI